MSSSSASRFRAVQYRDMPISEFHKTQETQAMRGPGNSASLKVMGKTGQPVAVDPTRVPTFEDVLQQYKEDPEDKVRVMQLLKQYLQALVPPESAGIVN
jgi:hypothetical protein